MANTIEIKKELVEGILNYLAQQRYVDVFRLIAGLQQAGSAAEIKTKEEADNNGHE